MNDMQESESGYIGEEAGGFGIGAEMTDVEIISISGINVIARGRRFGRFWLLKGLIPEMRESLSARRMLQKEFELHSRLLHPHIVRVTALEEIPGLGICIVEEWVEGDTLARLLSSGTLSKKERRRILGEILSAVGYLHSAGVVHRDLKPQNIMVKKKGGGVVLIDFGLADSDDYAELKQAAGTDGYISPEQLTERKTSITDDIYSLGVVMKELYPEYSRIAAKCTGAVGKRPKDTAALSRMLDRADRRPKLVAWGIAAALLASAAIVASLHIRSVSADTAVAQVQIDSLTDSNAIIAAKVAKMDEELFLARGKFETSLKALYSANTDRGLRRRAFVDAYRKIEKEYVSFDKYKMPRFAEFGKEFLDSIDKLNDRCDRIAREAYDLHRYPELADVDSMLLVGDVRDSASFWSGFYLSIWMTRLERNKTVAELKKMHVD